jgi:hypothetical protein
MEECPKYQKYASKIEYMGEQVVKCTINPSECPYSNVMMTRRDAADQDRPTPLCASKGLQGKVKRIFKENSEEFIPDLKIKES